MGRLPPVHVPVRAGAADADAAALGGRGVCAGGRAIPVVLTGAWCSCNPSVLPLSPRPSLRALARSYLGLFSLTQLPLNDLMRVEVIRGRRLGNLLLWGGLTFGVALITVLYAAELGPGSPAACAAAAVAGAARATPA